MVATRERGEDPDDREALYEIHCIGQDSILRSFASTMHQGLERTILLDMLNLPAENPIIMLRMAMSEQGLRPDNGYNLKTNEATAIIVQSRSLGSDGHSVKQQNTCEECTSMLCGLGLAFPFIECAGAPSYNRVNVTCANCIWIECDCTLTLEAVE